MADTKQTLNDVCCALIDSIPDDDAKCAAEAIDAHCRAVFAEMLREHGSAKVPASEWELESHEQERGVLLGVCEAALGPRYNMTLVEDVQELVRRCRQWEALRDDVIACARFANYYSKAENGYALNARRVLAALSESIAHVAATAAEPTTGEVPEPDGWHVMPCAPTWLVHESGAMVKHGYNTRWYWKRADGGWNTCDGSNINAAKSYALGQPPEPAAEPLQNLQQLPAAKDEPGLLPVGTPVRCDACVNGIQLPAIAETRVRDVIVESGAYKVEGSPYWYPAHAVHAIKAGAK